MMRVTAALRLSLVAVLLAGAACSRGSGDERRSGEVAPTTAATTTASPAGAAVGSAGLSPADDWLTFHHDIGRHGVAGDATPLGSVKRAWTSPPLDGKVYAQPLVAGDLVLVATEGDSVYALHRSDGSVAWRSPLGRPVDGRTLPCGNINPSGITGTPVVDAATRTVYVVAFLADGPHHELSALDLGTGAVRWHRPIDPPGLSGKVEQERGALALSGGRVSVPYGGLAGDCGPYKGAVVSAAADGTGDLAAYVVPTTREAGIWTPGGPVVDESGDLWIVTGNSESDGAFDYGNAVIHLNPSLGVVDYFAPANWATLNRGDVDLGSATPVLLSGGRVFAIGKEGVGFLLDRSHLGHEGGQRFSARVCAAGFGTAAVSGDLVYVPCTDGLVALRMAGDRFDVAWRSAPLSIGSPIVAGGAVWAIDGGGTITAFDPGSGVPRFTEHLGTVTRFGAPAAGHGLVVAATDNRVAAFNLR